MDWYVKVLKQYADFEGRARRQEYWMFALINGAIILVLAVLAAILAAVTGSFTVAIIFYVLIVLYELAVFLPGLGVLVRRLHDTGRPGIMVLLAFIPAVGGIILLVFAATEGTRGPNQYGPDPKAGMPGPQGGYGPGPQGGYGPGPLPGQPAGYPGAPHPGGYGPGPQGGYPPPPQGGYPQGPQPGYPAPQPGYPAGGPRY